MPVASSPEKREPGLLVPGFFEGRLGWRRLGQAVGPAPGPLLDADPQFAAALGDKGRYLVESEYSLEAMVRATEAVYDEVLHD